MIQAAFQFTHSLRHPRASFMFNAQEWAYWSRYETPLSMSEQGRLFTQIIDAFDRQDFAFLAKYRRFVYGFKYPSGDRTKIPIDVRAAVFARDGAACVICGDGEYLALDHVIPFSKGGPDTVENLRVLCRSCNSRKGAKMPESAN